MMDDQARKANFWLFLKDNPGKLALLVSALGLAVRSWTSRKKRNI